MIAGGDRARTNWIDTRRLQIASEYVKLIDDAIARDSVGTAKRHMASLVASVGDHPDRQRLQDEIDGLDEARAAQMRRNRPFLNRRRTAPSLR